MDEHLARALVQVRDARHLLVDGQVLGAPAPPNTTTNTNDNQSRRQPRAFAFASGIHTRKVVVADEHSSRAHAAAMSISVTERNCGGQARPQWLRHGIPGQQQEGRPGAGGSTTHGYITRRFMQRSGGADRNERGRERGTKATQMARLHSLSQRPQSGQQSHAHARSPLTCRPKSQSTHHAADLTASS